MLVPVFIGHFLYLCERSKSFLPILNRIVCLLLEARYAVWMWDLCQMCAPQVFSFRLWLTSRCPNPAIEGTEVLRFDEAQSLRASR